MNRKGKLIKYIKALSVIVWIILFLFLIFNRRYISASKIADFSPENKWLAALVILLLYALKTLSVVFPYKLLQLASGMIFPVIPAILVNITGSLISSAVGYFMGRFYGTETVGRIIEKNDKLSLLLKRQNSNILFFSFFLRALVFLPLEAVSMYFGAVKSDFKKYMTGSILGLLPNIVISTVMGNCISEKTCSAFLVSAALFIFISITAIIWYYNYIKKENDE